MSEHSKKESPVAESSHPSEFLYLDNFRGFVDSLIPLRDITFLVGENSTGKSSVISTLNLVRNFTFWSDPDFDTEDQHLGGFNDLITAGSKKEEFTIGTARRQKTFTDKMLPFVVFASFTNSEGLPHISKLSFVGKLGLLTILETDNGIFYKHDPVELAESLPKIEADWLRNVATLHKAANGKNSTKLELKTPEITTGFPLYHLLGLAEQVIRKKQTNKSKEDSLGELSAIYGFMSPMDSAVWLAPIRTKPRRTYDGTKKAFSAEGDHTPYLLKNQLGNKSSAARFKRLVGDLGRDSHLFQDIRIKSFGSGESAPFEVQVNLNGVHLGLSNVGYGVSQVLPILAEIVARDKSCVFHIQQPEVHLHPRAQAALGDLFYFLTADEKKRFVIETHSDFLIDRFRSSMSSRLGKNASISASVVFFTRSGGVNSIHELVLTEQGAYPSDQPSEFRDFFIHEQLRNLSV